jgi:hypothetical protein
MKIVRSLIRNTDAAAAAEMVFVMPMLVILMFGSMELGNFFLTEHAVTKQVRDGARYASRLTLAEPYTCTPGTNLSTVFADPDAGTKIINVTKTGSVDGTASGRFPGAFWAACGSGQALTVSIRCVNKDDYGGIYASFEDDIPVVTVAANVAYPSLFSTLGFNTTGMCVRASSEVAVAGL